MQNNPRNKDTINKTETWGKRNLWNNKQVTKRPQNVTLLTYLHCYCPSILNLLTVSNKNIDDVFTVNITFHCPHIKQRITATHLYIDHNRCLVNEEKTCNLHLPHEHQNLQWISFIFQITQPMKDQSSQ